MAVDKASDRRALVVPGALLLLLVAGPVLGGDGIRYEDVAGNPAMGLRYARVPSRTDALYDRLKALPAYGMPQIVATPEKPRGAPGVALLDFDRDGDLDVYVTNGRQPLRRRLGQLRHPRPDRLRAARRRLAHDHLGGRFLWNGYRFRDGGLAVEINRGGNGNRSAAVRTLGSAGLAPGGRVNRDGIGAVLRFTPQGLPPVLRPVIGGASYASQDSLEAVFGMGRAERGTLDVLWPGGSATASTACAPASGWSFPRSPAASTAPGRAAASTAPA